MLSISDWAMYILTCAIAAGTPGPGTLAVITSSIIYGSKKTLSLMVGIGLGLGIVSAFTLLGLSQLITESHTVFVTLQYSGITYIFCIGGMCIKEAFTKNVGEINTHDSTQLGLLSGVWISVLNPKTFVFFMAFFPTYLAKNQSSSNVYLGLTLAFVLIGCTFTIHIAYSLVGQKLSSVLSQKNREINFCTGILFIILGTIMAL